MRFGSTAEPTGPIEAQPRPASFLSGDAEVVEYSDLVIQRIEALDAKRKSLANHLKAAASSEASVLKREGGGPVELCALVEWWANEGKRIKVTGLGTAVRDGFGLPLQSWQKWKNDLAKGWEPNQRILSGQFGSGEFVPRVGFVVYGLYGHDGTLIYIGRTENAQSRLRSHWNEKGPDVLDRWELRLCATRAEMRDLEAILIQQYEPTLNRKFERRNGAAS